LLLLFVIFLYNTHTISTWRYFNNGVKKFNDSKFDDAAEQFGKALSISNEATIAYNWAISNWMSITSQHNILAKMGDIKPPSETLEFNILKTKISKCHNVLDSLLKREDLPNNLITKILYVKGKLFLLEGNLDSAQVFFRQTLTKDNNFRPALLELVKLEDVNNPEKITNPEIELLINLTDVEDIGIVKNYNPF